MKPKTIAQLLACTVMIGTPTALLAEDSATDKVPAQCLIKAEKITGATLWDYHGNKLGSITQLLLEPSSREVFVVINADELLERDHKVVIPWSKLAVKQKADDASELTYSLDASKAKLEGAPRYEKESDVDLFDDTKSRPIYQYWDVEVEVKPKTARAE